MKAYVINLACREDRLQLAVDSVKKLDLELVRIEAVLGRELEYPHPQFDESGYIRRQGRRRVDAEVGCYLSHLLALETFLKSGDEHGLIIEDDVDFRPGAKEAIARSVEYSHEWDMLRLSSVNVGTVYSWIALNENHGLGLPITRQKGAGAYIVNRHAAQAMIKHLGKMNLPWDHAFDLEWLHGFRTLHMRPYVAFQRGLTTDIQNNIRSHYFPAWQRYWTVFPYRSCLEVSRFLHRAPKIVAGRLKIAAYRSR